MAVWEEIVDYTVPSNTTSVDFTGLNITKDDFIKVVMTDYRTAGSNSANMNIYFNNNQNLSDYASQLLWGIGATIYADRFSGGQDVSSLYAQTSSGKQGRIISYLKLSENNKMNWFANGTYTFDGDLRHQFTYGTTISNFTSVNQITFKPISGGLGANSRIQIYRLTAEKVADITVASNTTQVDITGLNIDKGSEYLLVSDVTNTLSVSAYVNLFQNNSTNESDYYTAYIVGADTTAASVRLNNSRILLNHDTEKGSLAYSHIKLSNIGAFTTQNYSLQRSGFSTLRLENTFNSSTAENIASINSLNLSASETNGIGTGSRFQLYKLY